MIPTPPTLSPTESITRLTLSQFTSRNSVLSERRTSAAKKKRKTLGKKGIFVQKQIGGIEFEIELNGGRADPKWGYYGKIL